jgi:hypothetical protein
VGDNVTQNVHHSTVEQMIGVQRITAGEPARLSQRDLETLLATLRDELRRARDTGRIDDARADAADQEFAEAADALQADDEKSRSRVVVALSKAKGLVEGLAGLTEKVAAAITAVSGLQ